MEFEEQPNLFLLDRSQVAKASDFDSDNGGSNPSGPASSCVRGCSAVRRTVERKT